MAKTGKKGRQRNKSVNIPDTERKRLFDLYVMPNVEFIKSLANYYTDKAWNVDNDYNIAMMQLYKYIHTYSPGKSLKTWLHIVVRRVCQNQNQIRHKEREKRDSMDFHAFSDSVVGRVKGGVLKSFADNISDEVFNALLKIPPHQLSAFLLQLQGYTYKEIVDLEYERGHLEKKSIMIVKTRIFWCKTQLRMLLKQYEKERKG